MTKAQLRIQELIDRKETRCQILRTGLARAFGDVWGRKDVAILLDIVSTDLIPLMNEIERLEERLTGRKRKITNLESKPKKSPK